MPHTTLELLLQIERACQAEFKTGGLVTQYNLSAWRDEGGSSEWSRTNSLHKDIVKQFHQKQLTTFSSVLMNLGPIGKGIRRNRRCERCRQLLRNDESGEAAVCAHCGVPLARAAVPWV